jgi:hypothetical protein
MIITAFSCSALFIYRYHSKCSPLLFYIISMVFTLLLRRGATEHSSTRPHFPTHHLLNVSNSFGLDLAPRLFFSYCYFLYWSLGNQCSVLCYRHTEMSFHTFTSLAALSFTFITCHLSVSVSGIAVQNVSHNISGSRSVIHRTFWPSRGICPTVLCET